MKETRVSFNKYLILACHYAFMEYDLGIDTERPFFQMDEWMVEMLGSCWVSCISVPDAARMIARKIQEHQEF